MGKGEVSDGIYCKGMEDVKIGGELDGDNGEVGLGVKEGKKEKKKRRLNRIG